jgi:hypothetical protein
MKKIVKKIPARISTTYQCEICKTKYRSEKKAKECEKRLPEIRHFKVGDIVFNLEPRCCYIGSKYFRTKMNVVKIMGPMLIDYEYAVKWLGSYGLDSHIFEYEVEFTCPTCGKKHGHLYYSPEIHKLIEEEIPKTNKEIRKILKEEKKRENLLVA